MLRLWNIAKGDCLWESELGKGAVVAKLVSTPDSRFVLTTHEGVIRVWHFLWDYEFPALANWDPGAEPYLANFLRRHSRAASLLNRQNEATWTDSDIEHLMRDLAYGGFGWLRPAGITERLVEMRNKQKKCFIATVVCGSEDASHVVTLRIFRDRVLSCTRFGRTFIGAYETISPPLASLLSRCPLLSTIVRLFVVFPLCRLVRILAPATSSAASLQPSRTSGNQGPTARISRSVRQQKGE